MNKKCEKIVQKLREQNMTIAFMESCTGGFLANEITNISGASDVLKVSAVTYSSEYKIKLGVDKDIIKNYTVYSSQTAIEMANKISKFANSNIGVGITGELGNTTNKEPKVYYSIYFSKANKYVNKIIEVKQTDRENMKREVANQIFTDILEELI